MSMAVDFKRNWGGSASNGDRDTIIVTDLHPVDLGALKAQVFKVCPYIIWQDGETGR